MAQVQKLGEKHGNLEVLKSSAPGEAQKKGQDDPKMRWRGVAGLFGLFGLFGPYGYMAWELFAFGHSVHHCTGSGAGSYIDSSVQGRRGEPQHLIFKTLHECRRIPPPLCALHNFCKPTRMRNPGRQGRRHLTFQLTTVVRSSCVLGEPQSRQTGSVSCPCLPL